MENIEVALRARPAHYNELCNNDYEIWTIQNQAQIGITQEQYNELLKQRKIVPGQKLNFAYNYCFNKDDSTVELYNRLVKRIALSSLEGINGTIFMYGQTGSGKTFTMMGNNKYSYNQNEKNEFERLNKFRNTFIKTPESSQSQVQVNNIGYQIQKIRAKTPNNPMDTFSSCQISNIQISLLGEQNQKKKGHSIPRTPSLSPPFLTNANNQIELLPKFSSFSKNVDPKDTNANGILLLSLQDIFSQIEQAQKKKLL